MITPESTEKRIEGIKKRLAEKDDWSPDSFYFEMRNFVIDLAEGEVEEPQKCALLLSWGEHNAWMDHCKRHFDDRHSSH